MTLLFPVRVARMAYRNEEKCGRLKNGRTFHSTYECAPCTPWPMGIIHFRDITIESRDELLMQNAVFIDWERFWSIYCIWSNLRVDLSQESITACPFALAYAGPYARFCAGAAWRLLLVYSWRGVDRLIRPCWPVRGAIETSGDRTREYVHAVFSISNMKFHRRFGGLNC